MFLTLHKKDSKPIPANYRPVSLTSHVVKVFERVIRKKIFDRLDSNDLIGSLVFSIVFDQAVAPSSLS